MSTYGFMDNEYLLIIGFWSLAVRKWISEKVEFGGNIVVEFSAKEALNTMWVWRLSG